MLTMAQLLIQRGIPEAEVNRVENIVDDLLVVLATTPNFLRPGEVPIILTSMLEMTELMRVDPNYQAMKARADV